MIKKRLQVWVVLLMLPCIILGIAAIGWGVNIVNNYLKNQDVAAMLVYGGLALCVALVMFVFSFNMIYVYTTIVIVDETGITWKNILHNNRLEWDEVKEFGIGGNLTFRKRKVIYFSGRILLETPKDAYSEVTRKMVDCDVPIMNTFKILQKMSSSDKKEVIIPFQYTPEDWDYIMSLEPAKALCEKYLYWWDDHYKIQCFYDPNEKLPKSRVWWI